MMSPIDSLKISSQTVIIKGDKFTQNGEKSTQY